MRWINASALAASLWTAAAAAFAQGAPLNASSEAVQVPATAVFIEQGTSGTRLTANVGARRGNLTYSFGVRSPEGSGSLFDTNNGLLGDTRFTVTVTYADFRPTVRLRDLLAEIRAASGIPGTEPFGDDEIETDRRVSEANRTRFRSARAEQERGGGPNVFYLNAGFNRTSLDYRDEATGAGHSDERFVGNIRLGFGRYLAAGGLGALSMSYDLSAKRPEQTHLCRNHPVNGATTNPPTLECEDVYLRGLTGVQTFSLRAEWRQYLGRHLAWNPSLTLPWRATEAAGSWSTLQLSYIDIDAPLYARLGSELTLHVGLRPQMRVWTESHAQGPVEFNLSVFLGGSFGLFPLS